MLGKFWIGLWYVFLPLLIQYKWTFFLCTKSYVNKCLSYSSIRWCQFTYCLAWHSCVSVLSITLLFHIFTSNEYLYKNGGGIECDEILNIIGWAEQYFFRFFRVINTRCSHCCEKTLLKTIPSQNVFENCKAYQFKIFCIILSKASVTIGTLAQEMKTVIAFFVYLLTMNF